MNKPFHLRCRAEHFVMRAIVVLLGALLVRADVRAATFPVTNTGSYTGPGSLQEAIVKANQSPGADRITLPDLTATIVLTGAAPAIEGDVTIAGPGPKKMTISGGDMFQPFLVAASSRSTFIGFSIAHGKATGQSTGDFQFGGAINNHGTLTLSNCVIRDSTQLGTHGGGIFNDGTMLLQNCTVSSNLVEGGVGGGVVNWGDFRAERSTFDGNRAIGAPGQPALSGSDEDGRAGGYGQGGAIYNFRKLVLQDCLFVGNSAIGGAGGHGANSGRISDGFGFYCVGRLGTGGNGGIGEGGAIFFWSPDPSAASLAITNCTFSGNQARGGAAGSGGYNVCESLSGKLGGTGQGRGGAVATRYAFSLTHCTVRGNLAGENGVGGGVLSDDTVTPVEVRRSIIAGNTADQGRDYLGRFASGGYNLIGVGNGGGDFSTSLGDLLGSGGSPLDPGIKVLADYGGPTWTHALTANAIARDAGGPASNVRVDQRGFRRPSGPAADIGAYEYQEPAILGVSVTPQQTTIGGSVHLEIQATGEVTSSLTYQWRRDGLNLAGRTSSQFSIAAQLSDTGDYTVVVSDPPRAVTSAPPVRLVVTRKPATVTLQKLLHVYDGQAKGVVVITDPPNLGTDISYNGASAPPVNAGTYRVVVTVSDPVFQGGAEASLTIAKADQVLSFGRLPSGPRFGDVPFDVSALSDRGLSITEIRRVSGPARVDGARVTLTGAGEVVIEALQVGSANFNSAAKQATLVVLDAAPQILATDEDEEVVFAGHGAGVAGLEFIPPTATSRGGSVALKPAAGPGRFSYRPKTFDTGTDEFRYQVRDPLAGTTTAVPVQVLVNAKAPVLSFEVATRRVNEDGETVVLKVLRTGGSRNLTVSYATEPGSAEAGRDLEAKSGSIHFGLGQSSADIVVRLLDDYLPEPDKRFKVSLLSPTDGGELGAPSSVEVTIGDNDGSLTTSSFLDRILPDDVPTPLGQVSLLLGPQGSGGGWRLPQERVWHEGGETVGGLEFGEHEFEFRAVPGFREPFPVLHAISQNPLTVQDRYVENQAARVAGRLQVRILPEGLAPLAAWRLRGDRSYLPSGAVRSNLAAGTYFVEARPVSGSLSSPTPVRVEPGVLAQVTVGYRPEPANIALPQALTLSVIQNSRGQDPFIPYSLVGQLRSASGFGSGIAVRKRVVLTAAHVLLDATGTNFVKEIQWYFQRQEGGFEPRPLVPLGWYCFEQYLAARRADHAKGLSPDQSTPSTRQWDVAALYFGEAAARNGQSGYLLSEEGGSEWLEGAHQRVVAGYPLAGTDSDGRVHGIPPGNYSFSRGDLAASQVFDTTQMLSFPGNSGGPLCVVTNRGNRSIYFPAAIYLGQSEDKASFRAIDLGVVDLINRAASSADIGTNFTGFGTLRFLSGEGSGGSAQGLTVVIKPPEIADGLRWGFANAFPGKQFESGSTVFLAPKRDWMLMLPEVDGYSGPSEVDRVVRLQAGLPAVYTALYVKETQSPPSLTVRLADNYVHLEWPLGATGFGLETTQEPGSPSSWRKDATAPVRIGETWTVEVLPSTERRFYRLTK